MQEHFLALADLLSTRLESGEGFLARFSGETSHFVRFNRSAVRQSGTVEQHYLTIELFRGRQHVAETVTLTGSSADEARLTAALGGLREVVAAAPEDPHFLINTEVESTTRFLPHRLPASDDAVGAVLAAASGHDFVGFYASGPIHTGFANSFGQRNWDTVHAFSLDGCFYLERDRAVKMSYAGTEWDPAAFETKIHGAKAQLATLAKPARTILPGGYRVFLAPAAMEDILAMLTWGGFSLAAHRTATTPLMRLVKGQSALSPLVSISEDIKAGLAPKFQGEGFVKPDAVSLIAGGHYQDCLASPRMAAEFNAAHNAAGPDEAPVALDMAAGSLADTDILGALGTGLFIGNLWYLNYSDRNACRLTGMTRFATFWVEDGQFTAPVNVMRFDDSVYRVLGSNLIALTAARELLLSTSTYESRSTRSMHLPGALIDDFKLTL